MSVVYNVHLIGAAEMYITRYNIHKTSSASLLALEEATDSMLRKALAHSSCAGSTDTSEHCPSQPSHHSK